MPKDKKPDLVETKPLRPVGPPKHVHNARAEYRVQVLKGTVECLLICNDCPQRAKLWEKAVPGFHAPEKD